MDAQGVAIALPPITVAITTVLGVVFTGLISLKVAHTAHGHRPVSRRRRRRVVRRYPRR